MNYNLICSNSPAAWNKELNMQLRIIAEEIPANSQVLGLGSAQGRESLFLASSGYTVEKSEIGHKQLIEAAVKNSLKNILAAGKILSFEAKNIRKTIKYLRSKRVKIIKDAIASSDEAGNKFFYAYFYGPESIK